VDQIIAEIERKRKRAVLVVVAIGFMVCSSILLSYYNLASCLVIFSVFCYAYQKKSIEKYMKDEIVPRVLKEIEPSLEYDPNGSIMETRFREAGLYSQDVDRVTGDNYTEGFIDGRKVAFSDIEAEINVGTKSDTRYTTIFKGIFFIVYLDKTFDGYIGIMPASSPLYPGRKVVGTKTLETVLLENVDFNDMFHVKATDQVLARVILTPLFMETLLFFQEKQKQSKVHFSFIHDKMYLGLHKGKKHFSVPLFRVFQQKYIDRYFEDVKLVLEMVKRLNNT
jgi:hypothetical protein